MLGWRATESFYVTEHDTSAVASGTVAAYLTWFGSIGATAALTTVVSRPAMAHGYLHSVRVRLSAGPDKEIGMELSVNGSLVGTTLGTVGLAGWTLFTMPKAATRYAPGDTLALHYTGMEVSSRAIIRALWRERLID
jgi:hypothetical protein